jgi:hypothetical protein
MKKPRSKTAGQKERARKLLRFLESDASAWRDEDHPELRTDQRHGCDGCDLKGAAASNAHQRGLILVENQRRVGQPRIGSRLARGRYGHRDPSTPLGFRPAKAGLRSG